MDFIFILFLFMALIRFFLYARPFASIYFKQKSTSKYEKELLNYLGNDCILIESKYDGLLAEFDLFIASQFIIYYIGRFLDIDVSKPKYSDNAMRIYFYKGEL